MEMAKKMPMKKKVPKGKHMMNGRMMSDAEMERMMGKEKAKPRQFVAGENAIDSTITMDDMWKIHDQQVNRRARI